MSHGGKRKGAGRKRLHPERETVSHVHEASDHIDRLQPRAVKTLEQALSANTRFPQICGRDDKGRPEYEYIEVPDHGTRTRAAVALLNKRIPDLARSEHTGKDGKELGLGVIVYPGEKKPAGAD